MQVTMRARGHPNVSGTTTQQDAAPGRPLRSTCAVACTLDVIGDRWTLLVIRDLFAGKTRYGEFLASAEKIPTNILADRLKRLEQNGLVERVAYSQRPRRDEYRLTAEGRRLGPVLDAVATWGAAHFPGATRFRSAAGSDARPHPNGNG
jgi:DNA-binding HxlR family transcriptional regulator